MIVCKKKITGFEKLSCWEMLKLQIEKKKALAAEG